MFHKSKHGCFCERKFFPKKNVIVPPMTKVPPNVPTINGQNYDLMYS